MLTAQKFYKYLEEILIKAENAIRHMPVRKEVVFFPYKASMWDRWKVCIWQPKKMKIVMHTVCLFLNFDLNMGGSFGIMHYEGNFFHNPYDEWSCVTSVHPRYYAKNLRQYTDKLIYISYFVPTEI